MIIKLIRTGALVFILVQYSSSKLAEPAWLWKGTESGLQQTHFSNFSDLEQCYLYICTLGWSEKKLNLKEPSRVESAIPLNIGEWANQNQILLYWTIPSWTGWRTGTGRKWWVKFHFSFFRSECKSKPILGYDFPVN